MHVHYNVTGEDFFAFRWYTLYSSRYYQFFRLVIAIIGATLSYFFAFRIFSNSWYSFLPGIPFGVLVFIFFPNIHKAVLKKSILKYYHKGDTTTLFGMKTMELNTEGVTENSNYNHYSVRWKDVERIVETSSHFFIYLLSKNAFILPKKALGRNKQIIEFRSKLKEFGLNDLIIEEDVQEY